MSLETKIQLNNAIIPSVPFLWYREQELLCPIEYVGKRDDRFIIVQRHILDVNVYICIHSFLYYVLHNNGNNILHIPQNYAINKQFNVKINEIETNSLIVSGNSLKNGINMSGPVFIHDGAFSPTGFPLFKVNLDKEMNEFECIITNNELGINVKCLFVLFNNLEEIDISDNIKKLIDIL